MFEKLLNQIKDPALEIVHQQPNIPIEKKEIATQDAIAAISETIDAMMDKGDFSSLSGIKDTENIRSNAAIKNITEKFSQKLQHDAGLDAASANDASDAIIPALFLQMKEKFSGEKMDLKSLMSNLSLGEMMKLMFNMGKLKEAFK